MDPMNPTQANNDEKKEETHFYMSTNAIQAGKNYQIFLEFLKRFLLRFQELGVTKFRVEFVYPEILEEIKRHEAILSEERARLSLAIESLSKIKEETIGITAPWVDKNEQTIPDDEIRLIAHKISVLCTVAIGKLKAKSSVGDEGGNG